MVGEMRDTETARIAVQAALTGHLVLSTLHTIDAATGITRLLDMGVEDYLVTSTVNAVFAQRLVRKLCDLCKMPINEGSSECAPVGCEECGHSGYSGRVVIYELLVISDAIRSMILKKTDTDRIKEKARELGMVTMYECGLELVEKGITSRTEVLRVTNEN